MMSAQGSYFIAVIASIGIHAAVIVVVLANWEPESKKTVIQPQYIEAELIELAPKKKSVKKTCSPKRVPNGGFSTFSIKKFPISSIQHPFETNI